MIVVTRSSPSAGDGARAARLSSKRPTRDEVDEQTAAVAQVLQQSFLDSFVQQSPDSLASRAHARTSAPPLPHPSVAMAPSTAAPRVSLSPSDGCAVRVPPSPARGWSAVAALNAAAEGNPLAESTLGEEIWGLSSRPNTAAPSPSPTPSDEADWVASEGPSRDGMSTREPPHEPQREPPHEPRSVPPPEAVAVAPSPRLNRSTRTNLEELSSYADPILLVKLRQIQRRMEKQFSWSRRELRTLKSDLGDQVDHLTEAEAVRQHLQPCAENELKARRLAKDTAAHIIKLADADARQHPLPPESAAVATDLGVSRYDPAERFAMMQQRHLEDLKDKERTRALTSPARRRDGGRGRARHDTVGTARQLDAVRPLPPEAATASDVGRIGNDVASRKQWLMARAASRDPPAPPPVARAAAPCPPQYPASRHVGPPQGAVAASLPPTTARAAPSSAPAAPDAREKMILDCVALFDQALSHISAPAAPSPSTTMASNTAAAGDASVTSSQPSILSSFHCTREDGSHQVEMNVFLGRRLSSLGVDLVGKKDGLFVHAVHHSPGAPPSLLQKGDCLTEVGNVDPLLRRKI